MALCYSNDMKMLVISDTHGNYPLAMRACDLAEPIDAVIHLGDGIADAEMLAHVVDIPVIRVAGNCDLGSNAPREMICEWQGKRLLLTHGDRYGVKNGLARLEQLGIESKVDAVLFGHTHQATITHLSGMLFVNPGTLISSTGYATFSILEITADNISASLHSID